MGKDYYKILGVDKNATDAEIKKAYRTLSKKWHPDRFANDTEEKKKEADEKFKEINEANSVLSDQQKRRVYDMGGSDFSQMGGGFGGFNGFGGFGSYRDWFDMEGFTPFGKKSQQSKRVIVGDDITIGITLTAKEAYTGVRRTIKFKKKKACSHCNGTGSEDKERQTCPVCGGRGTVIRSGSNGMMFFQSETICPNCGGTGTILKNPCHVCNGLGYEEVEQTIDINIPAGILNDTGLILSGYGNPPIGESGQNGNLIVKVTIIDCDDFLRDGDNLVIKVKLSAEEAWLGCQKELTLPNNEKIWVTVNEMSKPNEIISIFNGKGYPNMNMPSIRGDLVVVAEYDWPKKLTDKQREILKEFFNIEKEKNV